MAEKNLKQIRENIIESFHKDFPGERVNGKIFSLYILDRYATLLYKLYKKASKKGDA